MNYITPKYMNLRTDFAFKQIFGTEQNKHLLIQFLNELFDPEFVIKDVNFENKEVLPFLEGHRRVVYDVYCTTADDRHIIVEMQQTPQTFFINRMLIYTGMGMVHQAKKGKWNYRTDPIFGVFVTNFHLHGLPPKMVRKMGVTDLETGELMTSSQRWFVIDLSQMKKKSFGDCDNELERWIYCLKNMNKFEEKPKGHENFYPLFEASETAMLGEAIVEYRNSEQRLIDEELAREEYGEEKRAQGIKEGIKEGILQMARKLKLAGQSDDFISALSGLPPEVIATL